MYLTSYCLIKLILITCVVGVINVEYRNNNETDLERKINQTLHKLEANLLDRYITYVDGKISLLNKKIEDKMTEILNESNRNIEERITQRLRASLDAANKNLEEKIKYSLDTSNKKLEEKMTQTLDIITKGLPKKTTATPVQLPCKEKLLNYTSDTSPAYLIYNGSLNHAKLVRNSSGSLTYFETHFAIEADKGVYIWLMNKINSSDSDIRFQIWVGYDNNRYVRLDRHIDGSTNLQHVHTPDILSATEFRPFYIKIDTGKLEFGKGGGTPLFSYNDARLGLINYFQFNYYGNKKAKIGYDCACSC